MTGAGEALRLLTFADLDGLARARRDKARSPEKIAGWDRLIEVLADLIGGRPAGDDIAIGRTWTLMRVQIADYQGVAGLLDLHLDPPPGVTVVHGPNGSGKSSIADAVETALLGAPRRPALTGGGGKTPLWEREHCGRDAQRAHVKVTLRAGNEVLELAASIDPGGGVVRRTATLDGGSGPVEIDLSAGTWASALAGHRPVFGYAALERQVQRAGDLQEFLEPLLAFGGCVTALRETIEEAATPAREAAARFGAARTAARVNLARVDAQRHRVGVPDVPHVTWPRIGEDRSAWLATQQLSDDGPAVPEITADHAARIRETVVLAEHALAELEAAETSVHARLAGPLRDLHAAGGHLDDPGTTCPVCGSANVGWLPSLGEQLDDLVALTDLDHDLRGRLRALDRTLASDVAAINAVVDEGLCGPEIVAAAEPALAAVSNLRSHLEDGHQANAATRAALRAVASELVRPAWQALLAEAVSRSDHRTQWLRARRATMAPFLACWAEVAEAGAHAPVWQAAADCLKDLERDVRAQRADDLHVLTGSAVQDLLADVGLTVTDLTVQATKAAIMVTDMTGRPATLSMLSAGQRNALLLAPLLAVAQGGPFGFLVVDDPVHALDEIRVDRLAQVLHTLARCRRVVVLTHDERLTEHLLARAPACDVREVVRDVATGTVTPRRRGALWTTLVADARRTLAEVADHPNGVTITPTDLVRGFCRMAVDSALRQYLITAAAQTNRDPAPDLEAIDQANRTRDRLAVARALHPSQALNDAEGRIARHERDWNRAAHGNPALSPADAAEIDAAEAACQTLENGP